MFDSLRLGDRGSDIAGIIYKPSRCGILPHNREERQDAASTNGVYELFGIALFPRKSTSNGNPDAIEYVTVTAALEQTLRFRLLAPTLPFIASRALVGGIRWKGNVEIMQIRLCRDPQDLGRQAAIEAAACIRQTLSERGVAHVLFATGTSQLEMLLALVAAEGIDWTKVVGFHLDEYVNLPETHPASFRKYLSERLIRHLPFRSFYLVNGEAEPTGECRRLGELIRRHPIDLALIGIGENGHLAFNDPPADFQTEEPYLVVRLDEACRRQQLGEGWFPALADVPQNAISMSIRQILKSRMLLGCIPDRRKSQAVRDALEGPVTPEVPASILQQHPRTILYLDPPAAELLSQDTLRKYRFA